jgi:predicted transcriptional regulator
MELHSSADIVSDTVDTSSTIQDILSAISDDKSLAIFRVIAEEDNTGVESLIICRNLQLTHKKYYRRLAALIRYSLIIRKDGSKKYILTSLGKVVYTTLLSIQYALDNIWKFRAIDEVKICDNCVYGDIDKIVSSLVDTLVHDEQIKEILKNESAGRKQMSGEKDLNALFHVIKKVRRAVLRNSVDGELGKTQAECYGLLADLQDEIARLYQ